MLSKLFNHDYIKRFSLKAYGGTNELIYYLDNPEALRELVVRRGISRESLNWVRAQTNRRRPFIDLNSSNPKLRRKARSRLLNLDHELMIARMRGMVELHCQRSGGGVKLKRWLQGKEAHSKVRVPSVSYDQQERDWALDGLGSQTLPCQPDAVFVLAFYNAAGEEELEFACLYEAQRTTDTERIDLLNKYRALYQFVMQRRHREEFGVSRIRAVLTEALGSDETNDLRELSKHPVVLANRNTPTPLFLFTSSEFFEELSEIEEGQKKKRVRKIPRWLLEPGMLLNRPIWFSAVDDTALSLLSP